MNDIFKPNLSNLYLAEGMSINTQILKVLSNGTKGLLIDNEQTNVSSISMVIQEVSKVLKFKPIEELELFHSQ
eukprot:13067211-Ditylum_brightwellii.AAC.1